MTLVIDDVCKRYGPVVALDHVGFQVEPGQVFGFLGANGAGKTTTMRIVLDILRPDSGRVTWRGRPNIELDRSTFGYLPEERGLYPRMRVLEQLVFFAGLYGIPEAAARKMAQGWLERFRVTQLADRRADELSKGNQQKIQFIAAILHDPEVVLMDEPFTGLDPINVALLRDALLELAGRGRTLIISTHQMELVEALADTIAIIDHGRLVTSGATRDVRRRVGRSVVRLAVAGDRELAWAPALAGVERVVAGRDVTELGLAAGVGSPIDPARRPGPGSLGHLLRGCRPVPRGDLHRAGRPAGRAGPARPGPARPGTALRESGGMTEESRR